MATINIQALTADQQPHVRELVRERWGAETVVAHETIYQPHTLPGFVAVEGTSWLGLLTYQIVGAACEIVTLESLIEGRGVGSALIAAVQAAAVRARCRRLWLITTNDNLNALRFYQKRGFVLVGVHREAVMRARRLKPEIPLIGDHGIPIRDELELEMLLPG